MRFAEHVERAVASLPAELRRAIRNVEISVEDEHADDPDLFGLYEGVPLPERGDWADRTWASSMALRNRN